MISMIVAYGRGNVIGKNNELLWDIPNDMRHFKETTTGKVVVMGRKTFESIGRPLPNRENIVITRDPEFRVDGVEVLNRIEDIERLYNERYKGNKEVVIIGGEEIYRQTLDLVEKIYVTYVDEEFKGDAYFPEIDENEWELVEVKNGILDEKNKIKHEFREYKKK